MERTTKFVTIGRHDYVPAQKSLLEAYGLQEEVERIEQVGEGDISALVQSAKEAGACIVVQALPMPLLARLVAEARRQGVEVLGFRIENLGIYSSQEEALAAGADVALPSPEGTWRGVRFPSLQRILGVRVDTEDVVTR